MQTKQKKWYKRWWAIVLFIFIGLSIIGSFLPDESSTTEEKTQETQLTEEEFFMKGCKEGCINTYPENSENSDKCTSICFEKAMAEDEEAQERIEKSESEIAAEELIRQAKEGELSDEFKAFSKACQAGCEVYFPSSAQDMEYTECVVACVLG